MPVLLDTNQRAAYILTPHRYADSIGGAKFAAMVTSVDSYTVLQTSVRYLRYSVVYVSLREAGREAEGEVEGEVEGANPTTRPSTARRP